MAQDPVWTYIHYILTCVPSQEDIDKNKFLLLLLSAIKNGIAKYMKQAKQCQNKSKKYKELSAKLPFKCYMNLQGPSYYCLKNPTYTKDE